MAITISPNFQSSGIFCLPWEFRTPGRAKCIGKKRLNSTKHCWIDIQHLCKGKSRNTVLKVLFEGRSSFEPDNPRLHLSRVLEEVANRTISPVDASLLLQASLDEKADSPPLEIAVDGFARLDTNRPKRTGFPEVVWGPGKTPQQIAAILKALASVQDIAMATRITQSVQRQVEKILPGVVYHEMGSILTYSVPKENEDTRGAKIIMERLQGIVAVLSAGTSDLPVAEEARITAEVMGCSVTSLTDVGVAGLHRLLNQLPKLRQADVVIVVAGMDGALPSVVAGLIDAPVIAVPTSIGYGTAFQGVAPLLGALNACAPGVTVVNIDNGFGGAMAAARILKSAQKFKS